MTPRPPTGKAAINAAKTRCCRGHQFDHLNTRYWTDAAGYTRRACRACHREYQRRRKLARRAAPAPRTAMNTATTTTTKEPQ
ncbi:hypothetical protein [Mycolicibacter sinensis]